MKVVIFGAGGFLGKAVCSELAKNNNCSVYRIGRSSSNFDYNINIERYSEFKILPNDYFDIIINCAAKLPESKLYDQVYFEQIYKSNILGAFNLCKWISTQKKLQKVVNCSSLSVTAEPWPINLMETHNPNPVGENFLYSSSKLYKEYIFEYYSKKNHKSFLNLRFSALYGEGMNAGGVINNFLSQALLNKSIKLTNGNMVSSDFLYITDAAYIVSRLLYSNFSGIINVASGRETFLLELAQIVKELFDCEITVENTDVRSEPSRSLVNIDLLHQELEIEKYNFVDLSLGILSLKRLQNSKTK